MALALFEQNGNRAMPLGGKSLKVGTAKNGIGVPGLIAHELALELLLRIWQHSDQGPVQRRGGEASLLIAELDMKHWPEALPLLKASWLSTGDSESFQAGLLAIASRSWRVSIAKFERMKFTALEPGTFFKK